MSLTVGVGTVMDAREVVIIISGVSKARLLLQMKIAPASLVRTRAFLRIYIRAFAHVLCIFERRVSLVGLKAFCRLSADRY
jgi:6-phosphogluconolactonase/glucosamine-6-phosphate isomerase/deaminase